MAAYTAASNYGREAVSIRMYDISKPVFTRGLGNLQKVLEKGEASAAARKIDPAVLLGSRLYPDMFPLTRQVWIASDTAKNSMARLTGQEPPKFPDVETTFPELLARIQRTIDYVDAFSPEQLEGSEERSVVLKLPSGDLNFNGLSYLQIFALPNFMFHLTTAYNILRHNGVELGKMDFLGAR